MPGFLGAARSRKQLEVVASGPVARELELYTDRASGVAMTPEDEMLVGVIDAHQVLPLRQKLAAREGASFREGERPWS